MKASVFLWELTQNVCEHGCRSQSTEYFSTSLSFKCTWRNVFWYSSPLELFPPLKLRYCSSVIPLQVPVGSQDMWRVVTRRRGTKEKHRGGFNTRRHAVWDVHRSGRFMHLSLFVGTASIPPIWSNSFQKQLLPTVSLDLLQPDSIDEIPDCRMISLFHIFLKKTIVFGMEAFILRSKLDAKPI